MMISFLIICFTSCAVLYISVYPPSTVKFAPVM